MANKVPCGGFTIGDNMQVVDGELSSKVIGGYTKSEIWSGHLYNNTFIDDQQLYSMFVNHVGDTAIVTFIENTGGEIATLTIDYKIESKSFGIGFMFQSGTFSADTNTGLVSLDATTAIEVIEVKVEEDVKISSKYLDIDGGEDNYLPLTGGTLNKNGNGNVLTLKNSNGQNNLQISNNDGSDFATFDTTHIQLSANNYSSNSEIKIVTNNNTTCGLVNMLDSFGIVNSYLVLTTNDTRYKITVDSTGALKAQAMS